MPFTSAYFFPTAISQHFFPTWLKEELSWTPVENKSSNGSTLLYCTLYQFSGMNSDRANREQQGAFAGGMFCFIQMLFQINLEMNLVLGCS